MTKKTCDHEKQPIMLDGKELTPDAARQIVHHLMVELATKAPDESKMPDGMIYALTDPMWRSEVPAVFNGSMLVIKDPAMGWRGFMLPWNEVSRLVAVMATQLADAIRVHPATEDSTDKNTDIMH